MKSPTYLAKVVRYLVKPGILRAHRGVAGGVVLNRLPGEITLQSVVEACQGAILGDFCSEAPELAETCALHQAGVELNQAILGVLSRWTLADLLKRPHPTASLDPYGRCWLAGSPAQAEAGRRIRRSGRQIARREEEEACSHTTGREEGTG